MTEEEEEEERPSSCDSSKGAAITTTTVIPVIRLDDDDEVDTSSSEASAKAKAKAKLVRKTCEEVGFFYLEGHGICPTFLDDVMEQSQRLFALTTQSKESLKDTELSRGYTSWGEETLDPKHQTRGDTKEGYYIAAEISKTHPKYDPSKLRGPNVWPTPEIICCGDEDGMDEEACKRFRSIMEEYYIKMNIVGKRVTQLLAKALDLETVNYFDQYFEPPNLSAIRLLHYAQEESNVDEGIYACGAHSDYGMLTLLLTDQTQPGLQIHYQNQWIDVPPRPYTFVVNLGDMLERWSNGLFKSTLHRVLTSGESSERYSIPFFYEPQFDTLVQCLPTTTTTCNPPKYPPITSGEYLLNKYKNTHADFTPTITETEQQQQSNEKGEGE